VEVEGGGCSGFELQAKPTTVLFDEDPDAEQVEREAAEEGGMIFGCI